MVTALVLQCVAHDYALHELKHATVLARRLAGSTSAQKELVELQRLISDEVAARKLADQPSPSAS